MTNILTQTNEIKPVKHDPDLSMVWAFTGPRGSGKTLAMTYYALQYMARGLKVWSNYKIAYNNNGYRLECLPLNMDALYTFDEELVQGLVCIDEINLWANSRRSIANTNLLLTSIFQQIRKRGLSFFFTVQEFSWVDNRIRWQVDLQFKCRDNSHTQYGRDKKLKPGEEISIKLIEHSGLISGYTYAETNQVRLFNLFGKPVFNAYNTEEEFDVLGALQHYRFDIPQKVIGYDPDSKPNYDALGPEFENKIDILFKDADKRTEPELFGYLGITDKNLKYLARQFMACEKGIVESGAGGVRTFKKS